LDLAGASLLVDVNGIGTKIRIASISKAPLPD
jgi:hypothetical protein